MTTKRKTFKAETKRGIFTRQATTGRAWTFVVVSAGLGARRCAEIVVEHEARAKAYTDPSVCLRIAQSYRECSKATAAAVGAGIGFALAWSQNRVNAEKTAAQLIRRGYDRVEVFEAVEVTL